MIPEDLLPHLVEVTHPGTTTDRYGNQVDDWSPGAAVTVQVQAWMQLTTSREVPDQRDAQIGDWLLICNPVTAEGDPLTIRGNARVAWPDQGARFEVVGPPGPAYTPSEFHHYEVLLRSVEG